MYRKTGLFELTRNSNSNRQPFHLSKIHHQHDVLQSRALRIDLSETKKLRFLPQDFHNCGKHCGKRGRLGEFLEFVGNYRVFFVLTSTSPTISGVILVYVAHLSGW